MEMRKTKIVCSCGPACANDETIKQMILAGMNVARFNFSHGDHNTQKEAMDRVKRVSAELGIPVALLLDTKGPEIRTGIVKDDGLITLKAGMKVEVTVDGTECTNEENGKPCHISLSWKDAPNKLKQGHKILIADGLIELVVDEIKNGTIYTTCSNDGKIGSKKNVNLIGVHAGLPIMAENDKSDIAFGVTQDVDFIAASFVSFPEEVVEIKNYLHSLGSKAKIIAKIENEEGLNNIEKIVKEADGIMVARGDLGVQLPTEKIPLAQKKIIRECHNQGKTVITATQMLDSMIVNPRPTRAELTDVSNAVFDGTDAVMLSGETANGKYPVEAVKMMSLITSTTEQSAEYIQRMRDIDGTTFVPGTEVGHMVTHSAYKLAKNIEAKAIVIPTLRGNTARMVSSFRPEQVVLAVTPDKKTQRQLLLCWGVVPILTETVTESESMIQNAIKVSIDNKMLNMGDRIVMCAGIPLASPLMANTIKVLIVGNILARGTRFGFNDARITKATGRVLHADVVFDHQEKIRVNRHTILVTDTITEDLIPILRVVDGVVSENGSEIDESTLKLVNPTLIWIKNAPNAVKNLENDLSVTIDGKEGLVYEGTV